VGGGESTKSRGSLGVEGTAPWIADGRLAAAHLAVDDRGAFATIDQQLGDAYDDFAGAETTSAQAGQDGRAMRPVACPALGQRGWRFERVEQLIAELGAKSCKADREWREAAASSRRPLHGGIANSSKIEDMVMLQEKWGHAPPPWGGLTCPRVGRNATVERRGKSGSILFRQQQACHAAIPFG